MGVPTTVPPLPKQPRWAFIHPFQLRLRRGIETSLWNLAAALSENGVSVEILTWSGPLGIPERVQRAGVRIRAVPEVRYYQHHRGCLYYLRHLLASRYDHVFVNFAGYGEGPALEIGRAFQPAPFTLVAHFPRSDSPPAEVRKVFSFLERSPQGAQKVYNPSVFRQTHGPGIQRAWICRDCDPLRSDRVPGCGGRHLHRPQNPRPQGRADLFRDVPHHDRRVLPGFRGLFRSGDGVAAGNRCRRDVCRARPARRSKPCNA